MCDCFGLVAIKKSSGGLGEELLFLKAGTAEDFDISMGRHFTNRGMRSDNRDAFGIWLSVPARPVLAPAGDAIADGGRGGAQPLRWRTLTAATAVARPPIPSPSATSSL